MFMPNRDFRRKYDRLYRKKPEAANLMLLFFELADNNGQLIANRHHRVLYGDEGGRDLQFDLG